MSQAIVTLARPTLSLPWEGLARPTVSLPWESLTGPTLSPLRGSGRTHSLPPLRGSGQTHSLPPLRGSGQTNSLPPLRGSGQRDYPGDVFLLHLFFTIYHGAYIILSLASVPDLPCCLKCAYYGEGRGLRLHWPPCIHSCAYTMPCRGSQGHQASRRDKGDIHSFTDHIWGWHQWTTPTAI